MNQLSSKPVYCIGIDLGGTHLRASLVDVASGEISQYHRVQTHAHEGHEKVIERMIKLIGDVILQSGMDKNDITAIGIGVPGTPNIHTGQIKFLPNLPGQWRGVELAKIISSRLDLPVNVLNDVRSITFGEWKFGAGQGAESMVCIAIGTGIGGGIIINNKLHLGIEGTAGEVGHIVVEPDGLPCGCGGRGCLEMYASGPAIASLGVKFALHGHTTKIAELVNYDIRSISAETITQAAKESDPAALFIIKQAGKYLGIAISSILVTISPQKVIIGGGVAEAGEVLLSTIRETLMERVHMMPVDQVELTTTKLGNTAGLVGSALWAAFINSGA
jgi:glucokinase